MRASSLCIGWYKEDTSGPFCSRAKRMPGVPRVQITRPAIISKGWSLRYTKKREELTLKRSLKAQSTVIIFNEYFSNDVARSHGEPPERKGGAWDNDFEEVFLSFTISSLPVNLTLVLRTVWRTLARNLSTRSVLQGIVFVTRNVPVRSSSDLNTDFVESWIKFMVYQGHCSHRVCRSHFHKSYLREM